MHLFGNEYFRICHPIAGFGIIALKRLQMQQLYNTVNIHTINIQAISMLYVRVIGT